MPMTERYARALVAQHAKELREAVNSVLAYETNDIIHHKLAEIAADCAWCERQYGIHDWNESQKLKEGNRND